MYNSKNGHLVQRIDCWTFHSILASHLGVTVLFSRLGEEEPDVPNVSMVSQIEKGQQAYMSCASLIDL